MDIELEKKINDVVDYLKGISNEELDFRLMDPIAKMMLVSLLYESQKIEDYVDGIGDKLVEKFCEDFIPRGEIEAMPALAMVEVKFKPKKESETIIVGNNSSFTYKLGDNKNQVNYIPIVNTLCIPIQTLYVLGPRSLRIGNSICDVYTERKNYVWIGINSIAEIESLNSLSLLISGTNGVLPDRIYVDIDDHELEYSSILNIEDTEFAEPFDSQQSSGQFFSIIENWKETLMNLQDQSLLYIIDKTTDRDVFRTRAFPKVFEKWLEEDVLKTFNDETLWLRLEFSEDYTIPDTFNVQLNILPVTNVDVNTVTLTQISPIAKLQKQENSFFLQIIETSNGSNKQGFNMLGDDIVVRDFDASCYHEGRLYRDVRNLYNRFRDDYYAFVEYNGIKDGETIKQLRDIINRIGKSVGTHNHKYSFDSGTYVMKNMNQYPQASSVKVSFATTLGKVGNSPRVGDTMENKKLPSIEKDLTVISAGMGGRDKASADEKYENLRYYSLTNDRLFTKKDIEAFLRKEIIFEFGKEELKRIYIDITVEGAGGDTKLQRGLYITIKFKDKKNFDKAFSSNFKYRVHQKIINRSCISMPIITNIVMLNDY